MEALIFPIIIFGILVAAGLSDIAISLRPPLSPEEKLELERQMKELEQQRQKQREKRLKGFGVCTAYVLLCGCGSYL